MTKKIIIETVQEEVEIGGKTYTVREMTGADYEAYLQEVREHNIWDEKSKRFMPKDANGTQTRYLSFCMYDSNGKRVPMAIIASWGMKAIEQLSSLAYNINRVAEVDEAKKD